MSFIGKKFVKTTEIEVIDETANALVVQNVNDGSSSWLIPKSKFEENYVEVDMAVSNTNENNTKEVE